ncbi:hypothetical protein B566_EDAN015942 [Ephemera danica]|nr:hypothetical protein B566_EDAN015942 [Ephemera danica]
MSNPLILTIFTLNCWGIPFVSKDRAIRMDAIANQLATGKYDVVCLQEVWSNDDFDLIKDRVKEKLPYAHYFHSGVIGSGVCILSKYPITDTLFHQWSVNGYCHKIQHGDWFGGKGVGLCRLDVNGSVVNVYTAHDVENREPKPTKTLGIPFVSKDRAVRMDAIANQLATGKYDVVCLQEVWSNDDFDLIKDRVKEKLPYAHYFHSGVIGSGVCILSKYPITDTLFHQWSVNGYCHKIQHGDWFGGKGVGLCRLDVNGSVVNVYTAHLHAEYDRDNDEYLAHRVVQAFDTAQFVKLTSAPHSLSIIGGDLNTEPEDLAFRIIMSTAQLKDAHDQVAVADECNGTNESTRNSYADKALLKVAPQGKRIDYILFREPRDSQVTVQKFGLPLPATVPGHEFSFSDHEALAATITVSEATQSEGKPGGNLALEEALLEGISADECNGTNESTRNSYADKALLKVAPQGKRIDYILFREPRDSQVTVQKFGLPLPPTVPGHEFSFSDHEALAATITVSEAAQSEGKPGGNLALEEALLEGISVCDSALALLRDQRFSYSLSAVVSGLVLLIMHYLLPYVLPAEVNQLLPFLSPFLHILCISFLFFTVFMATIWNCIEVNGILAGKLGMLVTLGNRA